MVTWSAVAHDLCIVCLISWQPFIFIHSSCGHGYVTRHWVSSGGNVNKVINKSLRQVLNVKQELQVYKTGCASVGYKRCCLCRTSPDVW